MVCLGVAGNALWAGSVSVPTIAVQAASDVSRFAASSYTDDMLPMTPNDAQAWQRRWRTVNAHRVVEVRAMSMDEKANQLSELMSMRVSAKWTQKREAEVQIIRQRWAKLREAYGCLE
jgi:hypothetical protein